MERKLFYEFCPRRGNEHNKAVLFSSGLGAAKDLTDSEKRVHGKHALKMYWDALNNKPTNGFDSFIDLIFWDEQMQKSYTEEDLVSFGEIAAMYMIDHPYYNKNALIANYADLAARTPVGMIPSKDALTQVIAKTANETGFSDLLDIIGNAVVDSASEFKEISKKAISLVDTGIKSALIFKALGFGSVIMTAYIVFKSSKKKRKA